MYFAHSGLCVCGGAVSFRMGYNILSVYIAAFAVYSHREFTISYAHTSSFHITDR